MGREIGRANAIVSDLLDYSRDKRPEVVSAQINREIIILLKECSIPENIRVETQLDPKLPYSRLDTLQIRRVFYNLIVNGLQAMKEGGVLRISSRSSEGYIEVSVQDSGTGIPLQNIDQVFEPLFSTKSKGVGLGLAIAKHFVEKHDGKIWIESDGRTGTVFTVRLPFDTAVS